jgi:hypothetical protein
MRHRSIAITNLGIIGITIALDLETFTSCPFLIHSNVQIASWIMMIIGFSLVLYSRLYLIIISHRIRRLLLPIVLVTILTTNILVSVLIYLSTYLKHHTPLSASLNLLSWKLQVIPPVQEIVLTSLYLYFFIQFLRGRFQHSRLGRKTFYFLCIGQVIIVTCDGGLLAISYAKLSVIRTIILPFLYALKLEFEFIVLNRLTHFTQSSEGVSINNTGNGNPASKQQPISTGMVSETNRILRTDCESGSLNHSVTETSSHPMSKVSSNIVDEIRPEQKDSMEEMERRYLGQYGIAVS